MNEPRLCTMYGFPIQLIFLILFLNIFALMKVQNLVTVAPVYWNNLAMKKIIALTLLDNHLKIFFLHYISVSVRSS